jgi:hypothetical protein
VLPSGKATHSEYIAQLASSCNLFPSLHDDAIFNGVISTSCKIIRSNSVPENKYTNKDESINYKLI